jgi:hypothetical protein
MTNSLLTLILCTTLAHGSLAFSIGGQPNQPPAAPGTATKLEASTALSFPRGVEVAQKEEEPSIGVLLLNLGGPETGDDVEGAFGFPPRRDAYAAGAHFSSFV